MKKTLATCLAWTVGFGAVGSAWAQDPTPKTAPKGANSPTPTAPNTDVRRKEILDRAATRALELDRIEQAANTAYDLLETTFRQEVERQRQAHATKRVEHGLALKKIDTDYATTMTRIATAKADLEAANEKEKTALDRELAAILASIQERARTAPAEAAGPELRKHDEKRAAALKEHKTKLEANEATRLRAIDAYLAELVKTQEAQQKELKELEDARTKLLEDHDAKRKEAREKLAKELDRIRAARREAHVAMTTELYEAVGIPGRTAPPLGAERHDLTDLSWERVDAAGGVRIEVLVDGKAVGEDAEATKLKAALARAVLPRAVVAEDGLDAVLRNFAIDANETLRLNGKPCTIAFSFPTENVRMPLPAAAGEALRTRLVRAIMAAHDRAPWDDLKLDGSRPFFYAVDASGKVLPNDPKITQAMRAIMAGRAPGSIRGLTVVDGVPAFDGVALRVQWLSATEDGKYVPLAAEAQAAYTRRWNAHVARLTGTGAIPAAVRARAERADVTGDAVNLQRPIAISAVPASEAYLFFRQGRELVVVDAKTKETLFRVEGLYQLTRLAFDANGGLAFAGTRIQLAKPIERAWTKKLDNELKTADVVDDEHTTTVKDGEALFIYAGGKLTLAMAPTLGRFGAVRASKDGYRVWFWDRDERQLVEEVTLKVAANGSSAEPDVAGKPGTPQLRLEATAPVAPAPMPKTGGKP